MASTDGLLASIGLTLFSRPVGFPEGFREFPDHVGESLRFSTRMTARRQEPSDFCRRRYVGWWQRDWSLRRAACYDRHG